MVTRDGDPSVTAVRWPPALRPRFLFLRHGTSMANAAGLVAGSWDVPLAEAGREEARRAAAALAGTPLAAVLASDLRRAVETAEVVAGGRGLPLGRLAGLGERDWGPYQGRPVVERPAAPLDPPGVEPWAAFSRRVLVALAGVEGPGPVLVVAHRGVLRVVAEAVGAPPEGPGLANAEPVWVEPERGRVVPFVADASY